MPFRFLFGSDEEKPIDPHPPAFDEPLNLRPPGFSTAKPVIKTEDSATAWVLQMTFATVAAIGAIYILYRIIMWIYAAVSAKYADADANADTDTDVENGKRQPANNEAAEAVAEDALDYASIPLI